MIYLNTCYPRKTLGIQKLELTTATKLVVMKNTPKGINYISYSKDTYSLSVTLGKKKKSQILFELPY